MTQRKPFDPAELDVVLDQWTTSAIERLDELIDSPTSSVIDVRDASIFFAGTLAGQLGVMALPIAQVNKAVAKFQEDLDSHLMRRLPQHPPNLWQTNANLH